jgi:4-alpha-glucanotransferase
MTLRFSLLAATSQLNSSRGNQLGTGTIDSLLHLGEMMSAVGIVGDIYDLPSGSQDPSIASPFSLNNGFALKTDELNWQRIPELTDDPGFLDQLSQISDTYDRHFRDKRTVNYVLKRTLMPWILSAAFRIFQAGISRQRLTFYEAFLECSRYWLDTYALFEVYKEQGIELSDDAFSDLDSEKVGTVRARHQDRLDYYRYEQFICYEQRLRLHESLQALNTGLIVNLPFGVERASADVLFHPEVFDKQWQVGCSPEPEHGYPEQAWGIAAYRERTDGLKRYLKEKMRWIARLGDGVFIDHLVGWCGQYVLPMTIPADSVYPHGAFLTEDLKERMDNLRWFLSIVNESGLRIRGEIAGDSARVKATNAVVAEMLDQGRHIGAMAIPRWEKDNGRMRPLNRYSNSTLTMVETHDTSTLLQYLLNRKGYTDDFESLDRICEFAHRVLGWPLVDSDLPLSIEQIGREIWLEFCRRFAEGTPAAELVFTLPSLLSMLSDAYRSTSIENNINVKPGTSGKVGNGWGNWGYFSPTIDIMQSDPFVQDALRQIGRRRYRPFDYCHRLQSDRYGAEQLTVLYSRIGHRRVVFRDHDRCWRIWSGSPSPPTGDDIRLELVVHNRSDGEVWDRIALDGILELKDRVVYAFQDLNGERGIYSYTGEDLRSNRLFVKLQAGQTHHFLVSGH